jgi:hypothetical protein
MLTLRSSCWSCALAAAGAAPRFDPDVANRVGLILTVAGSGADRVTAGDDTLGTGTGLRSGCGSGATFAALPMPLGSLIEPLSPRAFAGPGGMPLTPASWAGNLPGDARIKRTATASNVSRLQEKAEPDSIDPLPLPSGYPRTLHRAACDTHAPLFWESGPPPTFAHMPLPKSSKARLSPSICVISKLRIGLTIPMYPKCSWCLV